jgi:hypothetical protein
MIRLAEGHDGKNVRAEAARLLRLRGLSMTELPPDQLQVVATRTSEGRSYWYVLVRRDLVADEGGELQG